jgi:hypothetical protein
VSHVNARLDNRGITQPQPLSQIGVFANVGGGAEVLVMLCQSDVPNTVPSESQQSRWVYEPQLDAVILGVAGFTANVNWDAFVTREELAGISFGIPPANVRDLRLTASRHALTIRWRDPLDVIINDTPIVEWSTTKLVRKVGGFPEDEHDGELLVENATRDKYAAGLTDADVAEDVLYCYALFPTSVAGGVNRRAENRVSGMITDSLPLFDGGRKFDGSWFFDGN